MNYEVAKLPKTFLLFAPMHASMHFLHGWKRLTLVKKGMKAIQSVIKILNLVLQIVRKLMNAHSICQNARSVAQWKFEKWQELICDIQVQPD